MNIEIKNKTTLFGIAFSLFFPLLTYILTIIPCPFSIETDSAWIGFFGSFYGSLLACVISYFILSCTINENRRQYLWNQQNNEIDNAARDFSDAISFICDKVPLQILYGKDQPELNRSNYHRLLEYKYDLEKMSNRINILYSCSYPCLVNQYETIVKAYIDIIDELLLIMSEAVRDCESYEQFCNDACKVFGKRTEIYKNIEQFMDTIESIFEKERQKLIEEQKS